MSRLLNFIFPPRCFHCQEPLQRHSPLCQDCLDHVALVDVPTQICSINTVHCFDDHSPARSLLPRARDPSIAKLLAAFLIVQFTKLKTEAIQNVYRLPRSGKALSAYCAYFLRLPVNRRIYDRSVLLPTLFPLTTKEKNRLAEELPRQVIHISLFP